MAARYAESAAKVGAPILPANLIVPEGVDPAALQRDGLLWTGSFTGLQGPSNLTLGRRQARSAATTPADLQGKYLGLGTFQNVGSFASTENVMLTPLWAQELSDLFNRQYPAAQTFRGDFTLGLFGTFPGQQGQRGFYLSVQQYGPDPLARIAVGLPGTNPRLVLPGSTAATLVALNGGHAGGMAILNPVLTQTPVRSGGRSAPVGNTGTGRNANKRVTSYVSPGSNGFIRAVKMAAGASANAATPDAIAHFLGQAGVYGLAPIYNDYGLDVTYTNNAAGNVRYRVVYRDDPSRQITAAEFANLGATGPNGKGGILTDIRRYYQANLKNGDKSLRLGPYGFANLVARQGKMFNTTASGNPAGDYDALVAAAQRGLQTGNLADQFHYANGYGNRANRAGMTVWQRRTADGKPVANAAALSGRRGKCNLWVGGPGNSQTATTGGVPGLRTNKKTRVRRNSQGQLLGYTAGCGTVESYLADMDRSVYRGGGGRALSANVGLRQMLEDPATQRIDPLLTAANQQVAYDDALANPQLYGINPALVTPRGIVRNAAGPGASTAWAAQRADNLYNSLYGRA